MDDNLFEFWGALCDPHELDDAFAATTTSNALPVTISSSSTSTSSVSVSSIYSGGPLIETPIVFNAEPPVMHFQSNYLNGAYLSSQSHGNIRTEVSLKPSTSITGASTVPDDTIFPATVSDDETFSSNDQQVREYSISVAIAKGFISCHTTFSLLILCSSIQYRSDKCLKNEDVVLFSY